MRNQILEGSNVYYYNPGHEWNMCVFNVAKIVPIPGAFELQYGSRRISASADQVIHINDPRVREFFMQEALRHGIDPQDCIIRSVDRDVLEARMTEGATRVGESFPSKKSHAGHEVVQNHAGGKLFNYCRHCKEEVF